MLQDKILASPTYRHNLGVYAFRVAYLRFHAVMLVGDEEMQ